MFHFFQRYKRQILVTVIALVAIPFVFWGGGFGRVGGDQGPDSAIPTIIAQVGPIPITSADYSRLFNNEVRARQNQGAPSETRDLVDDGTWEEVLYRLVDDALYALELDDRSLETSREFLDEKLRDDPLFLDAQGEFDPGRWNQWISANSNINWNVVREQTSQRIKQNVFNQVTFASARVLDEDVRRAFEDQHARMKVRYATVEPKVEMTPEQLQAQYDGNPESYMSLEERTAKFIVISLEPPEPEIVGELVTRARGGEDFAVLAAEYSTGAEAGDGGLLEWIAESEELAEHRAGLFNLEPGAVSDPVKGPAGIHIYKVEEFRSTSPEPGEEVREVRAREILIQAVLSDAEKVANAEVAEALLDLIQEDEDFDAVAAQEGFEVNTTGPFSVTSVEIENIGENDVLIFRRQLSRLDNGAIPAVIVAPDNLYVAQITDVQEPRQLSLEEATETVERDAKNAYRREAEYREIVAGYVDRIVEQASTLDEAVALFPELEMEIQESEPFLRSDFLFGSGIFWQPSQVFEIMETVEVGELAEPIVDLRQITTLLELVEKTTPSESDWETLWPAEEEQLRGIALSRLQFERQLDYRRYLREVATERRILSDDFLALASGPIYKVLGLDDAEVSSPAATATTLPDAPSGDTPSEDEPVEEDTGESATPSEAADAPSEDTPSEDEPVEEDTDEIAIPPETTDEPEEPATETVSDDKEDS